MTATSGPSVPFSRTFPLALYGNRFLLIGSGRPRPTAAVAPAAQAYATAPKGTPSFAAAVHLTNVAHKLGLDFRQGDFRFGAIVSDVHSMMGGGLCWLDYNNDGWMDLFVVNSYSDGDVQRWSADGGLPRSALYENVHGKFVDVSAKSRAGVAVQGNGCVPIDLGNGYPSLLITTNTYNVLLWNNGNGTFTDITHEARIDAFGTFGWHTGAAVADVNGDGRPDIFVSGYADVNAPVDGVYGFPRNFRAFRDLLYLNKGPDAHGHPRFKEVGLQAGIDPAGSDHSLGALFTDVNGDGRPDLYVANDSDPNALYVNEPGGPLGFHFVNEAASYAVADPNADMGIAEGDYNRDGRPDLFVTNSRGQPHAVYQSSIAGGRTVFSPEMTKFALALHRTATVGWGDSWVDLANDGKLDLVLANGAIPVTNLKQDTEPMQILQNLGGSGFTLASGVIRTTGMPRIIGRGLAAADVDNNGRLAIAVNSIAGPLVLLENTGKVGNWLEVNLKGFHPGAVLTAVLPNGTRLVDELHAGSSYLSSEDPRAHFGLGTQTSVELLTIRYPNGTTKTLRNVGANHVVTVG